MKASKQPVGDAAEAGMSGVRAVERAVAVLQSFSADAPSMSVLDLQRRVGLSRPTLYRLLQTLVSGGLVEAHGDPQRFRLGDGVMRLAHVWLSALNVVDVARPLIEELREATSETAALFVLRGEERLCVAEAPSRHVLAISRGVGDTGHITQGASGKAILAFLDGTRARPILDALPDDARRAHLVEALAAARRNGFAISRSEVFVGAVAVAAPYRDHHGQVMGAIGLFGPSARLDDDRVADCARQVVLAAHTLSARLGHRGENTSVPVASPASTAEPHLGRPNSKRASRSG